MTIVEYYDCPPFEDNAKERCIKRAGSTCRVQKSYGSKAMDSPAKYIKGHFILAYCKVVGRGYARWFLAGLASA